ncbi:spindle pole body interacting protein [Eremomyces bilateralis CBS 781.70]|uniref:Spindle pole body interacting protein n=1 Tax=Eremomyces bilateralis CBS 781.70 TaxID=1392243 RepID=A0A6G1GC38_9PEZI|nr:spindle pole body interacting protein [Eremomyces bilateralis CBS 781.70]KAF1815552.1 spindle pole body interacting protein [Eremomyces bilateralis CBS 781.70]
MPFPEFSVDESAIDSKNLPPAPSNRSGSPTQEYIAQEVSQYPVQGAENHVEYILVASFDIDRGSVMEHQFPGPISGDEHMLAELMLPDQAHMRNQDWTIFFLHKDTTAEEEARAERRQRRELRQQQKANAENSEQLDPIARAGVELERNEDTDEEYDSELDNDPEDDSENPPLIYVLNLVNMKQDNTVKRGAIVKAMAICTRHPFLHIYKPLLLLALDEYFKAPVPETLASLYNAVNSMDLSLMPRLNPLERHILQASDAKDMFIEKFDIMIQQRMIEDAKHESMTSNSSDASAPAPAQRRYALPRDTHEFDSRVLYNGVPVPVKVPAAISPETVGDFSLIKLIQTFSAPHATSPQPFALHAHLTTSGAYTHPIIVLVNALLTQKRIIFLGHNQPSGSVAEAVLASCALASGGVLRGFTRHAFPYTDLTKIDDLLKVPGFIAGVTNPAFAHKPEWWDLLCDLPTGRMKISPKLEPAPITEGLVSFQQMGHAPPSHHGYSHHHAPSSMNSFSAAVGAGISAATNAANSSSPPSSITLQNDPTGDHAFMDAISHAITNRLGESAIRSRWRAWVSRFTRVAAAFETTVFGASALAPGAAEIDADALGFGVRGHGVVWPDEMAKVRDLAANASRIEGWRGTRTYFTYLQDMAKWWGRGAGRPGVGLRGIDLRYQCDRLRTLRLGYDQSAFVYKAIARTVEMAGLEGGPSADDGEKLDPTDEDQTDDAAIELELHREEVRYDVINQILLSMPESQGGLFYLGLGLFHPRPDVRVAVVGLLERIAEHPAGRHFWANLGRFAKLAFFRVKRELEAQTKA